MPKKYQVIRATTKPIDGVTVNGQEMKFGRSGGFEVSDKGTRDAIEQQYGSGPMPDVILTERDHVDPGHRNFWGAWPEMPWKRGTK